MRPYYQIDVEYANRRISQFPYEDRQEAVEAMRKMVGSPDVDSAILVHYSDRYPMGYAVVCSIRNKPVF